MSVLRNSSGEELERTISLLNAVIESTADGILVVNREGKIVHFNRKFAQMWRIPDSVLAARDDDAAISFVLAHLRHPERFVSKVRELYSQPDAVSYDMLEFKDGRIFERYSQPQTLAGEFVGRVWSFRDVTGRKRSERDLVTAREELEKKVHERTAELSRSNKFLDSLIENIPDMIFVKEAKELRFTRFNKAGEELLGYSRDELAGKNDYDLFPKSEAEFFTSKDRAVFESGRLLDIPEEPIHTRHKGKRILHTKKVPIYGLNGEPEYLLGISEDITEKKQAEETRLQLFQEQAVRATAERSVQMRDDFLSIAAHELKTPLTSLKMQVQLLDKLLSEEVLSVSPKMGTITKALGGTAKQLGQFTRLVDDLLNVSRMSAGKLVLDREEADLTEIVRNTVERYQERLFEAGCTLKIRDGAPVRGYWDPVRIEQVVVNLLTNAMKYGAGKPVEIEVRLAEREARLSIRDQGCGVEKKDQERIFERFERTASTKGVYGFGLGLYITRQIVEAHGGHIWVESELGKGSAFIVVLPLR